MAERDEDQFIARVARVLREPADLGPAVDQRVMAAVRSGRRPSRLSASLEWLTRPRAVALSPLGGLAMAAGLAMVAALGFGVALRVSEPAVSTAEAPALGGDGDVNVVQFVLTMPRAGSVSVVGDFNDWDPAATPLRRAASGGVWEVSIPLAAGRYRYTFIVDGSDWVPDPRAPRVMGDDFGEASSVVTVMGASS